MTELFRNVTFLWSKSLRGTFCYLVAVVTAQNATNWYDLESVSEGCIFKVRKFQFDGVRHSEWWRKNMRSILARPPSKIRLRYKTCTTFIVTLYNNFFRDDQLLACPFGQLSNLQMDCFDWTGPLLNYDKTFFALCDGYQNNFFALHTLYIVKMHVCEMTETLFLKIKPIFRNHHSDAFCPEHFKQNQTPAPK